MKSRKLLLAAMTIALSLALVPALASAETVNQNGGGDSPLIGVAGSALLEAADVNRDSEWEHVFLYSNGDLVFQHDDTPDNDRGSVVASWEWWMLGRSSLGWSGSKSVKKAVFKDRISPGSLYALFSRCSNLETIEGLENLDTSHAQNMGEMFNECSSLTSLDLSGFDTSGVTNMSYMFSECSSLTSLDLSSFSTSRVTNMSFMFNECQSLSNLKLEGFDTSNVQYMNNMFSNCKSLASLDVSGFETSKVISMYEMFLLCGKLSSLDVSGFDTANVRNMAGMFQRCESLTDLDVSGFDTSNVEFIGGMFSFCLSLVAIDVSGFDTSSIYAKDLQTTGLIGMRTMFFGCSSLASLDLRSFETSHLESIDSMFTDCASLSGIRFGPKTSFTRTRYPDVPTEPPFTGYWIRKSDNMRLTSYDLEQLSAPSLSGVWTWEGLVASDLTDLTCSTVVLDPAKPIYTGSQQKPVVTVILPDGTVVPESKYDVAFSGDCVNPGPYTVTIEGKDGYGGKAYKTFSIGKKSLTGATVTLERTQFTYDGTVHRPAVTAVTLAGTPTVVPAENYSVYYTYNPASYSSAYDLTSAGTYTVTVVGKGDYSGNATATFTVIPADISNATIALSQTDYVFDGLGHTPDVTSVTLPGANEALRPFDDYSVSYPDDDYEKPGTHTVAVTGGGNYAGTTMAIFTITRVPFSWKNCWGFGNLDGLIAQDKCQRLFGTVQGRSLFNYQTPGVGGMCYGMATSSAAVATGNRSFGWYGDNVRGRLSVITDPSTTGYVAALGNPEDYERDPWSYGRVTASDFVQYSFLMQFDNRINDEKISHWNDLDGLAAAVKASVESGTPIVIGVRGDVPGYFTNGGHALWPLRVISDDAEKAVIAIYDCNAPLTEKTLELYKQGGHYVKWRYQFASYTNGVPIYWGTDYANRGIYWSTPVEEIDEIFGGGGAYMESLDYVIEAANAVVGSSGGSRDTPSLVYASEPVTVFSGGMQYTLAPDNFSQTYVVAPLVVESEQDPSGLYWARFGDSVKVSGLDAEAEVGIASTDSGVTVRAAAGSELSLAVGGSAGGCVAIDQAAGSAFSIEYANASAAGSAGRFTLSGEGGSAVTAVMQDGGSVSVTGATSLTVANDSGKTITTEGLDPNATYVAVAADAEDQPAIVGDMPIKMHRLYNPNSYEHFYTGDDAEFANLVSLGWQDEQYGWTAPASGDPVYRLYNPNNGGDHHYTLDPDERDMLIAAGWQDEKIGWYSDPGKTVTVYREYNPNELARNHNYTANLDEHNFLVSLGWRDELIAWYGV